MAAPAQRGTAAEPQAGIGDVLASIRRMVAAEGEAGASAITATLHSTAPAFPAESRQLGVLRLDAPLNASHWAEAPGAAAPPPRPPAGETHDAARLRATALREAIRARAQAEVPMATVAVRRGPETADPGPTVGAGVASATPAGPVVGVNAKAADAPPVLGEAARMADDGGTTAPAGADAAATPAGADAAATPAGGPPSPATAAPDRHVHAQASDGAAGVPDAPTPSASTGTGLEVRAVLEPGPAPSADPRLPAAGPDPSTGAGAPPPAGAPGPAQATGADGFFAEMIRDVVRQELQGDDSGQASQALRAMVLREVARVLSSKAG